MASTPSPPRGLIPEVLSPRPLTMVPPEIIIVSSDDEDSSGRPKKKREEVPTTDNHRPPIQCVRHYIKPYASRQTAQRFARVRIEDGGDLDRIIDQASIEVLGGGAFRSSPLPLHKPRRKEFHGWPY